MRKEAISSVLNGRKYTKNSVFDNGIDVILETLSIKVFNKPDVF